MEFTNFDYIYAAAVAVIGVLMIASPRTFMGRAKYDEESVKTESLVKKMGIGAIVLAIAFAAIIFFK